MDIIFHFSQFCDKGKEIIVDGVISDELRISAVFEHADKCPVCNAVVTEETKAFTPWIKSMLPKLMKSLF